MWIRSVRAHPFGPIEDDTIELSEGLTVIAGSNESGKSSWHTAMSTALTGRRKGRPRKVDRAFADRHKPWNHDGWAVSCVVTLADGRSVRLMHDLARSTSKAIDEATGADITAELANDGGVDVARLVGLSRDTLPLVSSVRQAEVLALAAASANDDALGALRGFLQQSISSRTATETTAEVALDRLSQFRKVAIGTEKTGSLRPLRQALEAAETTERQLDQSIAEWNEHKQDLAEFARLEESAGELGAEVARRRVAVANARHLQAEAELTQARKLRLASSSDAPAPAPGAKIDTVRQALSVFEQLSDDTDPEEISGEVLPDAATLKAQLAALPEAPVGDLEPRAAITRASDDLHRSITRLETHDAAEPTDLAPVHNDNDLDAGQLRELAHEVERPGVHEPADERARLAQLEAEAQATEASPWMLPLFLTGTLALLAALLVAVSGLAGGLILPAILLVAGLVAFGIAIRLRASDQPSQLQLAELAQARYSLTQAEQAYTAGSDHRKVLLNGLADRGLPADGAALRHLATQQEQGAAQIAAADRWQSQRLRLVAAVETEARELCLALQAVDESSAGADGDPHTLLGRVDAYVAGCAHRRGVAADASRREGLVAQLDARRQVDRQRRHRSDQREAATQQLIDQAVTIGAVEPSCDDSAAATALRGWLIEQKTRDDHHRQAAEASARLSGLLAGREIDDLLLAVETSRAELDNLLVAAGLSQPPQVGSSDADASSLQAAEAQLATLSERMSEVRGRLDAIESRLADLAAVREAHTRAAAEYRRLQRLDGLAVQTDQFLRAARDAVHRDIAPGIAEATKHHLATVSGGRYKELRVNPDDLSVQVQLADGSWRLADRLSHGTAEQIYLLVRAAIAEIVAPDAEPCPLILDDVTVHADDERTDAMLDVLDELALTRQVIMFSQEASVLDWAERSGATVVRLPTP